LREDIRCGRLRAIILDLGRNLLSEIQKASRWRIGLSEAIVVTGSVAFISVIVWMWVMDQVSRASAHFTMILLSAGLVIALTAALLAYLRYQKLSENYRRQLAEAQARYKARADLSEARYAEKSDLAFASK